MGKIELPHKDEKVCANCKHLAWLIALGQGLRCIHNHDPMKSPPMVPSMRHTCNNFKSKHEQPESEGAATYS